MSCLIFVKTVYEECMPFSAFCAYCVLTSAAWKGEIKRWKGLNVSHLSKRILRGPWISIFFFYLKGSLSFCVQERAEHFITSELLEPVAASGEEGEPWPRHSVRPLPQQHHSPLRTDQRGLRTPLQEGNTRRHRSNLFQSHCSSVLGLLWRGAEGRYLLLRVSLQWAIPCNEMYVLVYTVQDMKPWYGHGISPQARFLSVLGVSHGCGY